ncbi:MAG: acetyl/propionyl/methylcrotonyl-CoA carboxylase subunit alpha [Burkholderiales bacterium]|nr:acetyl/propionyl/methylcrotonyl-CoA carboxylase subunit alpha [Burkholderiales bacterium]
MFTKILIANRGEIACRVIKTARRMGIATVAVYSDADATARHVRLADEAVHIGPAAARESYLVGEKILAAARATGAQAIHPGYGFLSENEAFAEACAEEGIVFIGPPASAIRAMGSKSAAKSLMEKAGVPLTPGYHGDEQNPALLEKEAGRIGYPVLIKATAGGGGKGMRRVDKAEDFAAALASCMRESKSAFGDDRVLVEQYVLQPRHIEIQVFADTLGHCVYLFERDCSVQRRHQKVLEEAPAPGMTEERRAAMGKAATEAAKAVGYVGAGTVEFIAHPDGRFYFMEMNTRLQVEHPVTEMITGLDLVEWQLRVAAGEPLPLRQDELSISGHAIEARIYAEDPDRGFLPSTGKLVHLVAPAESADVRVDTGVEQGDSITPFYDPMIAKLIVHAPDRETALARMQQALAAYRIVGVANNVEFLGRLIATPSFANAALDTALIEREQARLAPPAGDPPEDAWLVAAFAEAEQALDASSVRGRGGPEADSPWRTLDAWRLNGQAWWRLGFRAGETLREVDVVARREGGWDFLFEGRQMRASGRRALDGDLEATIGGRRFAAAVVAQGEKRHVFIGGRSIVLVHADPLGVAGADHEEEGSGLLSPMPGKVIALLAKPGAAVEKGAPLLVLEAMKMEHTISAPHAGTVKSFRFAAGDQVDEGVELVEFD